MVRLVSSLVIYPIGIACVASLYRQPVVLTGVLLALAVVVLLIARERGDVVVLVGGAVLGPAAEVVCVHFGAWTYAHPTFLGIPLWLPVGWGLATLLIKRISEGLLAVRTQ